ncbi:hypothetical protein ABE29_06315 [Cytobacillus firmus]|uniref:hypothetical protein n=1 Tax=Cytobacillus firmus TaxID=1399 RepID=UPI00077C3F03|nr:hypothetical protein [Cytobacillus firmus]MBG9542450.1 hypothetical protein [Cytobacillus firmus]MBG9552147.1 hypothetical protein [Cytobacillus firmus]MBG9559345.1 hypothetical protein [Cytobacillus firmus]MBG9575203.1 hypothetical protein [Cytobacillus firmus]MEC1895349.1 hypothetical protein [Cytobacillus firmus]
MGYFKKDILFNEIYHLCSDYVISQNIRLEGTYYDGESELNGIEIKEIESFDISIIAEEIIISGELWIIADCSYDESIPVSKNMDFLAIGDSTSFELEISLPFSLSMEMGKYKSIHNLQFEEPNIVGKPRIDPTHVF